MLNLQEISALRNFLDRVGDKDRPVVGKVEAFNLVACFQALDREERIARAPAPVPAPVQKDEVADSGAST